MTSSIPNSLGLLGEALLNDEQAARFLGVARRTLQNKRVLGGGPPFLRIGHSVRYDPADLRLWLESRRFQNTSEAAGALERLRHLIQKPAA